MNSSNQYADFRKVVYYYWSNIKINNNTQQKYRTLIVKTDYLDDISLQYRTHRINQFKRVLSNIDDLKYLPPSKIGRLFFKGGDLYHESKNQFESNWINSL